ncbi:hypothetical protein QBC33DRAFT_457570 [Phialemonium atrogriseum]|uniref:Cell cycle control protein n=1 Tax=Phialemonium atrogriseum TaxID=1093897 RepID=A0AAJ0BTY9_9PEZI|nr:uncharacterized protein QBC33DRAFT_457570 [Phialemonium atrogriseum]KAK1764454.1 hypothetical protein QBC33DRAFT_457570 [Phialemonium atrogriseum]
MPQPDRRRIDRLQVPEDDLVEMEVERVRERRRPAAPQVIDLTEEPDSPRQQTLTLPDQPRFMRQAARPGPPHHLHRDPQRNQNQNPRRHMSQNHRTPSLTRSDGSLLGPAGGVPVIDLTDDSPGLPEPRHNARNHARPRQGRQRNHVQAEEEPADLFRPLAHQIPGRQHIGFALVQEFRRFNHLFGAPDVEVEILGHNPPPHLLPVMENNPLADNPVNFNYQANGFNRNAAPPKPVHVPPPAARSGFTRATGEDLAVICPSCEQELKYDPNADESPPAKRARSRKDREEHHFWAIKACGHVYCKNCYEHRKSTAKSSVKTTFRVAPGRKVLCAVDDCDSDVVNKGSWVGIFL